jgi:hypothetical protein
MPTDYPGLHSQTSFNATVHPSDRTAAFLLALFSWQATKRPMLSIHFTP